MELLGRGVDVAAKGISAVFNFAAGNKYLDDRWHVADQNRRFLSTWDVWRSPEENLFLAGAGLTGAFIAASLAAPAVVVLATMFVPAHLHAAYKAVKFDDKVKELRHAGVALW